MGDEDIYFNETPLLKELYSLEEMCEKITENSVGIQNFKEYCVFQNFQINKKDPL